MLILCDGGTTLYPVHGQFTPAAQPTPGLLLTRLTVPNSTDQHPWTGAKLQYSKLSSADTSWLLHLQWQHGQS